METLLLNQLTKGVPLRGSSLKIGAIYRPNANLDRVYKTIEKTIAYLMMAR
jgi:hypothetical protein